MTNQDLLKIMLSPYEKSQLENKKIDKNHGRWINPYFFEQNGDEKNLAEKYGDDDPEPNDVEISGGSVYPIQ